MTEANELADRYVAMWTEPDAERRRSAIAERWTEDAVHILDPPQEAREAAAALDITPTFKARGHCELDERMTRAYEEFVAPGEFTFRRRDNVSRVGDAVKFNWDGPGQRRGGGRGRARAPHPRSRRPDPARLPVHRALIQHR